MNKERFEIIIKIIERAEAMGITWGDRITTIMDMTNADKEFNLRLKEFLEADNMNFCHYFIGIQNNMNRRTMKMDNFFVPRFSNVEVEA